MARRRGRSRTACLYEPHLPHLPARVGRESQDSVSLSVRGLWPRGARGHSRREEYLGRGARGLGEAACRCARSPWRGGKTGDHSRSFYEVGTRRSKGIGVSHARANVCAVGILGLQAAFRPGRMSIRPVPHGRHPRRYDCRGRAVSRGTQTGVETSDRFWTRSRRKAVERADHAALRTRNARWSADRRGSQLPTTEDRQVHLRGVDARLPG